MGLVAAAPEEKALSRLSVSYCQMQVNVLNRFAQIGNHLAVSSRTRLHAVRCPWPTYSCTGYAWGCFGRAQIPKSLSAIGRPIPEGAAAQGQPGSAQGQKEYAERAECWSGTANTMVQLAISAQKLADDDTVVSNIAGICFSEILFFPIICRQSMSCRRRSFFKITRCRKLSLMSSSGKDAQQSCN